MKGAGEVNKLGPSGLDLGPYSQNIILPLRVLLNKFKKKEKKKAVTSCPTG